MCRSFITVDVDSLLCQPENIQLEAEKHPAATWLPLLGGGHLDTLYRQIVRADALADIRAFFPLAA